MLQHRPLGAEQQVVLASLKEKRPQSHKQHQHMQPLVRQARLPEASNTGRAYLSGTNASELAGHHMPWEQVDSCCG